jgi:hypothetical protein
MVLEHPETGKFALVSGPISTTEFGRQDVPTPHINDAPNMFLFLSKKHDDNTIAPELMSVT